MAARRTTPSRNSTPGVFRRPTQIVRRRPLAFGVLPTTLERGTGVVGFSTKGQAIKRAIIGGVCAIGVDANSNANKHIAFSEVDVELGLSIKSGSVKTGITSGNAYISIWNIHTPPPPRIVTGKCFIGFNEFGQAVKGIRQGGNSVVGSLGTATNFKRAIPVGNSALTLAPDSRTHIPFETGVAPLGLAGFATATKRVNGQGRLAYGLIGRIATAVLRGTRVAPPIPLPIGPIDSSSIVWDASLPGASTLLVETSVDNGISFQVATSGRPIPNLYRGTAMANAVLIRQTMTRADPADPTPELHSMEVNIAVNESRDELIPLGVFSLNDVGINDNASGISIDISGSDLSRKISRNRWVSILVIPAGTNYADAIKIVVIDRYPEATFNFVSTPYVCNDIFFGASSSSNDPWADIQKMAKYIGCQIYFDAYGVCTMRNIPNPEKDVPVWTFEDISNPTMVDLKRSVTDADSYNTVLMVAEGSNLTVPLQALAQDLNPASPTYVYGDYGTVVDINKTSLLTSQQQCQDAADARLLRTIGATETVSIEAVPMVALEPGDIIEVDRQRTKVQGRFILDSLRYPLGAEDTQRQVGRRQRLT